MLVSIIGPIAWLVLTLLYVAFWAHQFTPFQSITIVAVSLLILAGVLGTTRVVWGTRRTNWQSMECCGTDNSR